MNAKNLAVLWDKERNEIRHKANNGDRLCMQICEFYDLIDGMPNGNAYKPQFKNLFEQYIDKTGQSDRVAFIAKAVHEMNRKYCSFIGDNSQPKWEDAPEWQKESAIDGVKEHLNNPKLTYSDSHNKWMDKKKKDGWKKGAVKDPEKKTHPSMVPYDDLPIEERVKDFLFKEIVDMNR